MMAAPSISIVLRSAGERTATHSFRLLERAFPTVPVACIAAPSVHAAFVDAAIAHASTGAEWALNVDADSLVAHQHLHRLLARLTRGEFEADIVFPRSWCYLHGGYAFVGVLLLNRRVLSTAIDYAKTVAASLRPDVAVVDQLRAAGFCSAVVNDAVALHDWGQFYAHVFVKMFNRGRRSQSAPFLQRRFELLAPHDMEARAALAGLCDAHADTNRLLLRWTQDFPDLNTRLRALGVIERPPMSDGDPCPDPDAVLASVQPDSLGVTWRVEGESVKMVPGDGLLSDA